MEKLTAFLEEEKVKFRKELNAFQLGTVIALETGVYLDRYEKAVEYVENKAKESNIRLIDTILDIVGDELTTPIIHTDTGIKTDKITYEGILFRIEQIKQQILTNLKK